jgi:uncharacterized membrane protein (DUF485 family)
MADLLHEPAGEGSADGEPHDPAAARRNARYGLVLFAVYLALYGGFVLLNTFAPQALAYAPAGGVNVAVLYGFGLIAAAFALALVYGWLCRGRGGPAGPGGPPA